MARQRLRKERGNYRAHSDVLLDVVAVARRGAMSGGPYDRGEGEWESRAHLLRSWFDTPGAGQ